MSTANFGKMYCIAFFLGCLYLARSAPLETVMVDMSYTYDERVKSYITWESFNNTVTTNGSEEYGFWVQMEDIRLSTHMGTHMDAPSHVVAGGLDVDQIPLTSLIVPAAVIDIIDKAKEDVDYLVTIEDLLSWETTTGHSLNGTVVLLSTGRGAVRENISEYTGTTEREFKKFRCPGFGPDAARWLVENRSIKGIGTDALNYDACRDQGFPAHQIFLGASLYGLERVANVDKLPIYGATLYVAPMKVGRGSGAPVRIIATYPKVIF